MRSRYFILVVPLLLIIVYIGIYQRNSIQFQHLPILTKNNGENLNCCEDITRIMSTNATGQRNDYIFQRLNRIVDSQTFQALVKRNPDSRDSEVIHFIRSMLDPPAKRMRKHSLQPKETPQSLVLKEIIDPKKYKGFFVECGALDGERSSNTNYLEAQHGWEGLLIEADPNYYTQVLGKNRKSWSINACLSPFSNVSFIQFNEMPDGQGHLSMPGITGPTSNTVYKVPCFPLESLLLAVNRTSIDFFSLDVEGAELDVLKSINYTRVAIKTLTVEYAHVKGGKQGIISFMKGIGMEMYKHIDTTKSDFYAKDLFFVKPNLLPNKTMQGGRSLQVQKSTQFA